MAKRPGFRLFKHYVRTLLDHVMFRKKYVIGEENVPKLGDHCVIPANHQNAAMDPIEMMINMDNRTHAYAMAMGGVFTWSPIINKFWDWLGMLPAFRIDFEGMDEAIARTKYVVDFAAEKITEGESVIIFPETNHHVEHWMRVWVVGYLEIAFRAAEKMNFEKDVKIVPMAHHYSSYYGVQGSYLLHYGEPVSLQPYYEQYKQKPRTTIRELNPIIRERVKEMMLYTDDLEHHNLYDFIRKSNVGEEHAKAMGKNPDELPERLESDQKLWAELEAGVAVNPKMADELTETMKEIQETEKKMLIHEHGGEKKRQSGIRIVLSMLAQLVLLPLWVFSLFPSAIMYYIPPMFMPGKEDPYYKVYTQSMQFILTIVLLFPIFSITTLLVLGLNWGWWWQAILWILLWFPLGIFAWHEGLWMRSTWEQISMRIHRKKSKKLHALYHHFYEMVQKLRQSGVEESKASMAV
jgi:1-acyl-sn-glycerol-3-phosphate acyltransferase